MTNAKARFSKSLHPRKREGSLGRTAQAVHLRRLSAAPELWFGQFACPDQYRVDYLRTPWSAHSPDCNKGPVLGGDGINICCITVGESVSGAAAGSVSTVNCRKRPTQWGRTTETTWSVTTQWMMDYGWPLRTRLCSWPQISPKSVQKWSGFSMVMTRHPRPPTLTEASHHRHRHVIMYKRHSERSHTHRVNWLPAVRT